MEGKHETLLELKMRYTPLARLVGVAGIVIIAIVRWIVLALIEYFH